MDIEKIAVKMAKVEAKLQEIQKAGTQSKTWAAIGQQHAVGLIPHQSVGQKVLNAAFVFRLANRDLTFFQESSDFPNAVSNKYSLDFNIIIFINNRQFTLNWKAG